MGHPKVTKARPGEEPAWTFRAPEAATIVSEPLFRCRDLDAHYLVRDANLPLINEPHEGITTIMVEQNAVAASRRSHRTAIIGTGEVVFDGTAQDVLGVSV